MIIRISIRGFPGGTAVKIHLPMQEMQEMPIRSRGREDPLEKEMATHSSISAWRIPWTEEPGVLQSMGLQRVRYNWATKHALYLPLQCQHFLHIGLTHSLLKELDTLIFEEMTVGLMSLTKQRPEGRLFLAEQMMKERLWGQFMLTYKRHWERVSAAGTSWASRRRRN